MEEKAEYQKPKLTIHGNVEEITQSVTCGNVTDQPFPMGTPLSAITCS